MTLADTAARVVPEVVALSLCLIDEGITFTVQDPHLPDRPFEVGPAAVGERLSEPHHDLLDEQGWQVRARASSARGIASSISLPVMSGRQVVWAIMVYASTPNAFEGRHHALAEALG